MILLILLVLILIVSSLVVLGAVVIHHSTQQQQQQLEHENRTKKSMIWCLELAFAFTILIATILEAQLNGLYDDN